MIFALIILAAILNACMDRVETFIHFNDSVFYKLNPKFYSKMDSSEHARRILNYKIDFWHLCKSGMLCCLLATPFCYNILIQPIVDYVIFGITYNIVFEQFYSRILKKKRK
jgi:hypothetical protein